MCGTLETKDAVKSGRLSTASTSEAIDNVDELINKLAKTTVETLDILLGIHLADSHHIPKCNDGTWVLHGQRNSRPKSQKERSWAPFLGIRRVF